MKSMLISIGILILILITHCYCTCSQIKEVQQTVSEKTAALEAEAFKTKRNFEETAILKRKVERLKKIEMATDKDMDEILKEEIREYKETLTCPSCKVKRKDAILTKCFHVFCYDCLRYVSNMFIIRELTRMSFQDSL